MKNFYSLAVAMIVPRQAVLRIIAPSCPSKPEQSLDPCEIIGPIGASGMGEVYKAADTRLTIGTEEGKHARMCSDHTESPGPAGSFSNRSACAAAARLRVFLDAAAAARRSAAFAMEICPAAR